MAYIKNKITSEITEQAGEYLQLSKNIRDQFIEATSEEIKSFEFTKIKIAKINEAKQKRNNNLANYVLTEGILKTNNIAETFMVLERYAKNLEQGNILAEFGLEDDILVKLTKNIIGRWIAAIETQFNEAWIDYRLLVKKINATKTITTLNKIEIK